MVDILQEYSFQTSLQEEDYDDINIDDIELDDPNIGGDIPDIDMGLPNSDQTPEIDVPEIDQVSDNEEIEDIEIDDKNEGDEVIDVTDITDSQDEIKSTIDIMMKNFSKLSKTIEDSINSISTKVDNSVDLSNQNINNLKIELEKRLPTDAEKINIRTLDSEPFNVTVGDYWANKAKDDRYDVIKNNTISPQDEKEYVLRKSDINNTSINNQQIYKTLDSDYAISIDDILQK